MLEKLPEGLMIIDGNGVILKCQVNPSIIGSNLFTEVAPYLIHPDFYGVILDSLKFDKKNISIKFEYKINRVSNTLLVDVMTNLKSYETVLDIKYL